MDKEWLKRFRADMFEVRQVREELEALGARMYTPRAQQYSAMPKSHSGDNSAVDGLIVKHDKLEQIYVTKIADIEARQLELEQAIEQLSSRERMLIRYRYIRLMSWAAVSEAMHYSRAQIFRMHGYILRTLAEQG